MAVKRIVKLDRKTREVLAVDERQLDPAEEEEFARRNKQFINLMAKELKGIEQR